MRVDAGKFNGADFKNLNAAVKPIQQNIVDIERLEAGIFDGKLNAKGSINTQQDGQNVYAVNMAIDKLSLEKLQRYLDMDQRMVTGRLSLKSDFTAAGSSTADFKKHWPEP